MTRSITVGESPCGVTSGPGPFPDGGRKPLHKPANAVARQAMAAFLHRLDQLEP